MERYLRSSIKMSPGRCIYVKIYDAGWHRVFWMNQYPVLFLSLKDAAGLDFESAYGMLESKIADLCKAHFYLADSKKVNDSDKRVFYRLCDEAAKPKQYMRQETRKGFCN